MSHEPEFYSLNLASIESGNREEERPPQEQGARIKRPKQVFEPFYHDTLTTGVAELILGIQHASLHNSLVVSVDAAEYRARIL